MIQLDTQYSVCVKITQHLGFQQQQCRWLGKKLCNTNDNGDDIDDDDDDDNGNYSNKNYYDSHNYRNNKNNSGNDSNNNNTKKKDYYNGNIHNDYNEIKNDQHHSIE